MGYDAWSVAKVEVFTEHGMQSIAAWTWQTFSLDFRVWYDAERDELVRGWCLSHLPTGRVVAGILTPLVEAQEIALEFALVADWSFTDASVAKSISPAIGKLKDRFGSKLAFRQARLGPLFEAQDRGSVH